MHILQKHLLSVSSYLQLVAVLLVLGCKSHSALELSLNFAKDNRNELEEVLDHYKREAKDSLKFKAACFLIENMPNYWSYQDTRLDHYRQELYETAQKNNFTGEKAVQLLASRYGAIDLNDFTKIYDSRVITADYLIRNIDLSFKVWEEQPWCKHFSFANFCEEILPYRVGNGPLENWRERYYNMFRNILDSIKQKKSADPVVACELLFNAINARPWILFQFNPIPDMGAINLLSSRIGSCVDRSELANYAMRSIGIPGGMDFILQYPNRMYAHSWNYVRDTTGVCVEYELYEHPPGTKSSIDWKKGRVYRKYFGWQDSSLAGLYEGTALPPSLEDPFMRDVSASYFKGRDLNIESMAEQPALDRLMYLTTFNNKKWLPMAGVPLKDAKATFKNVDDGIVYLPTCYRDDKMIPVSYPVILIGHDSILHLKPDLTKRQTLRLFRKYPIQPWWDWFKKRPLNGKFQASDDTGFSHPVTLYTIQQELDMRWHRIPVHPGRGYRYVRYLSGDHGYNDMAEVQVLSGDSLLKGKVIGTQGSYFNDSINTRAALYDGNPLTSYQAKEENGSWSGLDFGHSKKIDTINYLFRNDDNSIRINDVYELCYWDNEWVSLGKQTAKENELEFDNCPSNALFLLHDRTRGTEERVFTYEDHQQVWW